MLRKHHLCTICKNWI